jgi:two-component system, sensor histidine kinase and response regulator
VSHGTVLIVDDEVEIRETLREAFEDQGFVVRCASNGREGLASLRQFDPPCAVVLDLIMPLMNGNELYAEMQADPKLATIPVVVSTSDPSRAPPGVLIMKKPVDLGRLLSTVARLC